MNFFHLPYIQLEKKSFITKNLFFSKNLLLVTTKSLNIELKSRDRIKKKTVHVYHTEETNEFMSFN